MRNLIILPLVSLMSSCNAQNVSKCNCATLLIPTHKLIPLYEKPNGKIITQIINDTIKEDYYTLQIKEQVKGFSFVRASAAIIDTTTKTGWIETKYLGIYSSVYSDTLKLFTQPNKKSKVKSVINNPLYDFLNVIECSHGWLYIKYLDIDKKTKEGWLSPDNQCSNPYTTCN